MIKKEQIPKSTPSNNLAIHTWMYIQPNGIRASWRENVLQPFSNGIGVHRRPDINQLCHVAGVWSEPPDPCISRIYLRVTHLSHTENKYVHVPLQVSPSPDERVECKRTASPELESVARVRVLILERWYVQDEADGGHKQPKPKGAEDQGGSMPEKPACTVNSRVRLLDERGAILAEVHREGNEERCARQDVEEAEARH
eukprot:scaffold266415_cov32-Tisochrysis_lutea.AAC.2